MILRFFFLREVRKFPLFFFLLLFTIVLGTIGLTGIALVSQEVQEKLKSRAHELLTSDFAVSARRELTDQESEKLNDFFSSIEHQRYKVVDIYSMVTHDKQGQSRLAEIRGTEDAFPFHGKIIMEKGSLTRPGVKITRDLADLWGVEMHDELQVGELKVLVEGIVEEDSSLGLRGFSLAPRIYMPLAQLKTTGLLRAGATGSFAHHFLLPGLSENDLKNLKSKIYSLISDPGVKVVLPEDSSEQMGRVINVLSNFMALSALVGLILSLVGVFYLFQSHLLARLKDYCLLNLHGLGKKSLILMVVGQFTFIFALAFVLQVLFLLPLIKFIMPLLSKDLGIYLEGNFGPQMLLGQLPYLYGLALAILVPLLMGLLRTPMGLTLKSPKIVMGRFRFYDFIPFVLLFWFFSSEVSNSTKVGNIFFLCLLAVFALSTVLVKIAQWTLKKIIKNKGLLNPTLQAGIAFRNLVRSGNKLTLSFLSLTMGATLISLVLQLDHMIQGEFLLDDSKPGLFIFDIQEEQVEDLVSFSESIMTPLEALTPMIRGRLEKLNGKKFVRKKDSRTFKDDRTDDEENRQRSGGINITYREHLSPAERIVEGTPFPEGPVDPDLPALVSIEKRWGERLGVTIGDRLTFDIQGVELEGLIHNIREVKWTSFYPNFFVTVQPGHLDGAPKTYLAILPAGYKSMKSDYQRKVVAKFPNISFIDVEELVGKLALLFEKARQAIEFISLLSLGVGLVILYGLSHDQVYRRYYDLALMKTLGLSAEKLRGLLLIEFGALFFTALSAGLFLGWLIAQLIGSEIFKVGLSVDWARVFLPAFSLSVLCLATILMASWRTVRARPRELLSDS